MKPQIGSRRDRLLARACGILGSLCSLAGADVVFTDDFNGYNGGNQNALQVTTLLKVSFGGNLPAWTKAGAGAVHAVDQDGAGNYAVMIYRDNVITLASGLAANDAGAVYTVAFLAGPAVFAAGVQATGVSDAMLVEVLRGDSSVLASYVCQPGAWAGVAALTPYSFKYVGDGSGTVTLRLSPLTVYDHFAGSIDDLTVTSTGVSPSYEASLAGDFSYVDNRTNSTWSFRLDDYANAPPTFLPLLSATNVNANSLWGLGFPAPPAMWSEGAGYAGIGRNGTGVNQAGSGGCVWARGEVLLHPKYASPGRLVIGWKAPSNMVISVHFAFGRAMTGGNGTGYALTRRSSGADSDLVPMTSIDTAGDRNLTGIPVAAGDQLFFRIDNLGNAGFDVIRAAIQILGVPLFPVPPVITTQPAGGAVAEGCNFTFNVRGVGATAFQWSRNGSPISGATAASYSAIDAADCDAGSYTVVLTNPNGSVTSAPPAVLAFTARPAYGTVVFAETFGGYSGTQDKLQYQTALKVSYGGTLPLWGKAGLNAIHAVDRTGAGDYAPMIFRDNVLTLSTGITANEAGVTHHVDFVAGPAVYASASEATTAADGMVIEVLRGDGSVLATYSCQPGAWAGAQSFASYGFQYVGDGSGPVRLRAGALLPAVGRFGGAIDNLVVQTQTLPPRGTLLIFR